MIKFEKDRGGNRGIPPISTPSPFPNEIAKDV